jgi:hypothetical protein
VPGCPVAVLSTWGGEGAPRDECRCPWGLGAEIGQPIEIEDDEPHDGGCDGAIGE